MSNTALPLVTVLINNYNYGRFLGEAIESALNQTYPNVEVVVVDDGSTDDSREVIASFGDRVVAVLKVNGGQSSALNAGLAVSKGEWIHLLDSDDLFEPAKVKRIAELAAEYPTAALIAHDLAYCTAEGEPLNFAEPYVPRLALVDDRQLALQGKLSVSLPATSGLSIRRDVFERIGRVPEDIRVCTDNYLKWVTLSLYPVLMVPEFLSKQRIHGTNLGTLDAEAKNADAKVRVAAQTAPITFHMKRQHPGLTKLSWKQYGRILYAFKARKSAHVEALEKDIRARYSVVDRTPACFFYVAAAFTKAYVEDRFPMIIRPQNSRARR